MDIYDEEVERLTAHPNDIFDSWMMAKPLFKRTDKGAGCLTQIHSGFHNAYINGAIDGELGRQIRDDERIPVTGSYIKPEHLPIFAEWQRKIDKLKTN